MALPLQPITELDAINVCLANINESPINTLSSVFGDAQMAQQMLHDTSRKIQSIGLVCNTDYEYEIQSTQQVEEVLEDPVSINVAGTTYASGAFNGDYLLQGFEIDDRPFYKFNFIYSLYYEDSNSRWIIKDSGGSVRWINNSSAQLPPKENWVSINPVYDPIPHLSYDEPTQASGGEVFLPTNTLKAQIVSRQDRDFVERGRRIYDRLNHTYVIGENVSIDLVSFLEWEDLPQVVRNYITIHTARAFQVRLVGDSDNYTLTEKDELEAKIEFMREQVDVEQANFLFDSYSTTEVLHRTRKHVQGYF